jgi:hypothetical protein
VEGKKISQKGTERTKGRGEGNPTEDENEEEDEDDLGRGVYRSPLEVVTS